MAEQGLQALLMLLEVFRPALTAPGYENFVVLFAGWVRTPGTHAVTAALVATHIPGRRHHEAFHRFFSRGTWSPDEMGQHVYSLIEKLLAPGAVVHLAIDDTLAPKKGTNVHGIGCHLDAVRSTKKQKVFAFGHNWVTLAVTLRVPFSQRTWALPVLFRLYRTVKDCERRGHPHRKKTELARDLLDLFASWEKKRRIAVALDNAYCNDTVLHDLASNIKYFGAMRPDAALTALPVIPRRRSAGRPSVRGQPLPKPEAVARSVKAPWLKTKAHLYGKLESVQYKTFDAQWYRATGPRLLRIVVVRMTTGRLPFRVFFSNDLSLSPTAILEGYGQRWAIEVCFRDLKQLLGFADSSARKQTAVERTAPFVALTYSVLVVWAVTNASLLAASLVPRRPWYPHKRGLSFADILRAAQTVFATVDVLDLARLGGNLRFLPQAAPSPGGPALKLAG